MKDKAEGALAARVPCEVCARWRDRAKRLVRLAREAQFELTARTIRYMALMAVMTETELTDFNARIKKDQAERRARLRQGNAPKAPTDSRLQVPLTTQETNPQRAGETPAPQSEKE